MNPSAIDWIPKYLNGIEQKILISSHKDNVQFYKALKHSGFIYGVSADAVLKKSVSSLKLTKEEYTKINLFHTLLFTYFQNNPEDDFSKAIDTINEFYKKLEKGKTGFLKKLSLSQSATQQLENILSSRIQETNYLIKKNNISLLTYALLYIDVLVFSKWLTTAKSIKECAKHLESMVISFSFLALRSKKKKNKYDHLLIDLFESSSEYLIEEGAKKDPVTLESMTNFAALTHLEKKYILDLCTLAVWDDYVMDENEYQYLQQLSEKLQLDKGEVTESLQDLKRFSEKYTESIKLFEYSNPVKQFYKQSAATVKLLILRNKNRLIKELEESGELLVLLSHSTVRDLNAEEKIKVKEQLLDICKTIPSLTIFLLPGGAVLLPLLAKFIPKLLPSAFNENRINENDKK
ncbi:LETM1-like protein [Ulvibacter sp. MAR_2010_11]|uniref:LETM1-related biofilm-associated protein n=1 Tax=Ulvibacter sp. MAR_2010_11 TaxID=1250229 RepID=UPI000C2C16D0|nr:LETM1-related biofilm-associated protein [Ulvibacter sp. MAR_2010_11]PKA83867.1 LETM1-like protein [Ulvibacter sp. MAR_2010_11]